MQPNDGNAGALQPRIFDLSPDHMVDHPSGAFYVLWNGPVFLDVGLPTHEIVRFQLANLPPQWALLTDTQGQHLPIAVRYDGARLSVWWLPYDGPGTHPAQAGGSRLSDADYAAALQKLSSTRYQGLMDGAWGIGGWSTHRSG